MAPRTKISPRKIELNINSDPANVADVRRRVEALAAQCGFDEVAAGEIGLCLNEALANVIRHAYNNATDQPIAITADCSDGVSCHVSIRDWGNGFNPSTLPRKTHDPHTPGGLGLICLANLMDQATYRPQPDGMLFEMTRRRRDHGQGQAPKRVVNG